MCSNQNRRFKYSCFWYDHRNLNVNLIVKNEIQIKSGIAIIVGASGRDIYMQKITFGMLLHKVAKMVNI